MNMKYFYSILFSICVFAFGANAQNSGIRFEKDTAWSQVLKKAAIEKKLVFIDCYTSWCIPCKKLAKNTFPDKSVGDYFNERFVNVQYDMEKDSVGVMVRKKYDVTAFPTLLFVDPNTEEMIHKVVGAVNVEQLLAVGEQALNPDENLKRLEERYAEGDRGTEFLKAYFVTLMFAGDKMRQGEIALEYANRLPIKNLTNKEDWHIVSNVVTSPTNEIVRHVMDSLDYAYQTLGKETVDEFLYNVFYYAAYETAVWETRIKKPFDEKRNDEIVALLKQFRHKDSPFVEALLTTAEFVRQRDFNGMLKEMHKCSDANNLSEQQWPQYYSIFMDQLVLCDDNKVLQQGIDWLRESADKTEDLNLKSNYLRRIGMLLQKQGKQEDANLAQDQANEYLEQWKQQLQQQLQQQSKQNKQ